MKVCSTCKQSKDESEFGKDSRLKSGLRGQCKACHRKVSDKWRKNNPERVKQMHKDSYSRNRETRLQKQKAYRENLSDDKKQKKIEYCKQYYRENRERLLQDKRQKWANRTEDEKREEYFRQRAYYEENSEEIKKRAHERYRNLSDEQKAKKVFATKTFRQREKDKSRAWSAVGNAILRGELEKPIYCELCGAFDVRVHAHHEDYEKPLDVLWLCHDCHMGLHAEKRLENECVD